MSKKVDFDEVTAHGYRGRLINWEKWCDGDAHQLEQGVDYHGTRTDSTRSAGIQWAARHGMKAKTAILTSTSFVFQIVEGLSDDQVALARKLQALESDDDPSSDEAVQAALREHRQPKTPPRKPWAPASDPLKERAERLSDEIAAAGGPAAYARTSRRPGSRRTRT